MDKPNNIPVAPLTCLELFCQNVRMQIVICCFHPSLNWINRTARPYLRQRFSRLPAFMEPWCPNSFHPIPALFGGLFSLVIFVFMRAHSFLKIYICGLQPLQWITISSCFMWTDRWVGPLRSRSHFGSSVKALDLRGPREVSLDRFWFFFFAWLS